MANEHDDKLVDEFELDDNGYNICPVCKTDIHLCTDRCHNGGGEPMPGWFILCQECDTYAFDEYEPLLRPIPPKDKTS